MRHNQATINVMKTEPPRRRTLSYKWRHDGTAHELQLVHVPGTSGKPYLFGADPQRRPIEVRDFFIGTTPVTQALWLHVMGANPSVGGDGLSRPVENVSWEHITNPGGFLDRINSGAILSAVAGGDRTLRFRLPSETEWEYAARGGPRWTDEYAFSGSNDPDTVAWYGPRWTQAHRLGARLLGPRYGWRILGRQRFRRPTRTHDVATKAPQLISCLNGCRAATASSTSTPSPGRSGTVQCPSIIRIGPSTTSAYQGTAPDISS